jgi:hypothetical protein
VLQHLEARMSHHDEKPPSYSSGPVSALSPSSGNTCYDHDANAPEVVELVSPAVASPAHGFHYGQQRFPDAINPQHVDPNTAHEGGSEDAGDKEVVPAEYGTYQNMESALEPPVKSPSITSYHPSPSPLVAADSPLPPLPKQERKILGLRRKNFFILLAVLLVLVIAAVVGGAVGGVMSSKSKSSATDSASDTSSTTT